MTAARAPRAAGTRPWHAGGLAVAALLAACRLPGAALADAAARTGGAPAIEVLSAVAPAPPPGAPTMAVYLQLRNRGARPDALLAVETPVAGEAMVHEQTMDGGIMRMRMLARLELPAGAGVAMHAGGTHVMLAALRSAPVAGTQFPIRLRFERAGALTVQVKVLPPGSAP
jgi:copper(I)-binding protein